MTCIAKVALPVPRGDCYDYLSTQALRPGTRVQVPFGPRRLVGVVVESGAQTNIASNKLKSILQVIDDRPLLEPHDLALLKFCARYYQAPLGQCVATALPKMLRQGKAAEPVTETLWMLSASGRDANVESLKRAPRQAACLQLLKSADQPLPANQIGPDGTPSSILQALLEKGLVDKKQGLRLQRATATAPELNPEQAAAVTQIERQTGFQCALLDGVTGSGKTEVYLALARAIVAAGKQVMILVPEIGLTPQMVARVSQHTGAKTVAMHSGLSDSARHNAYLAARSGEADIVLGTRSAVFVPLANPGMIVIDEEHDGSYKQQDGIRYHARDLAVWRARELNIPIILGSATPSLETQQNAKLGRYQRLHLSQRHGLAKPPKLQFVDLRGQRCQDGLSNQLIAKMKQHLAHGQQVMLFINRRGFAPVLLCHDCGWTAICQRCDARLISHQRSKSLRCHHCDHQRPQPPQCPDCGSRELQHLGQGTERIESRVQQIWPQFPSIRLDRDQISRRGELEAALARIQSGEIRIIIGTQMLAKGHDFPRLSLVGVIDADQGLYGSDFRASEQLAQQITQVAGRAGRREHPGEVLIQTHNPEHPLLTQLKPGHYQNTADTLLLERELSGWPPFSHLVLIRAEAAQAEQAAEVLETIADTLQGIAELDAMGPVPAVMERRGGKYRQHLLLRSRKRAVLQAQLPGIRQQLEARPDARKIRWTIDVDPQFLD